MNPALLRFPRAMLALAAVVAAFGVGRSAAAETSAPLRVMSYNVRTSGAKDGENAWPNRMEFFFETIRRFEPTLIGFQEVRENQHDEITARLKEYAFTGVARDDGKRQGEWALIGYRKDRFT